MSKRLDLYLEVAGCPTICKHCWAQGVPYNAMPLEDIRWVLEQTRIFCADTGMEFGSFPMHEVAAHPNAPAILQLYREIVGGDPGFEPLATTGVPIVMREDWEELITAIGATGTKTFWVAFHGYREAHDQAVHREGAFDETCQAVRRIRSLGFRCGANIFVTKPLVAQFEPLVETLHEIGLDEMGWEPPTFYPTARGRQYEALRPELQELLPIAEQIRTLSLFRKECWADLQSYTEAHWRERAIAGKWPDTWLGGEHISLVCRNNFDLHSGIAGRYRERHGNLKRDGFHKTLEQAIQAGSRTNAQLFFGVNEVPGIAALAENAGDPYGQAIHFQELSIRHRWLDRALHAHTA